MGAFIISPLPPMLVEELRTVGPLGSTGVTPLPRYYEPHRHPRVFGRLPGGYRLYGLPCSADFAAGRGGLLQLRDASLSPCCHFHPAGVADRLSQIPVRHAAFALTAAGSASRGPHFRGHFCVRLRYGPVTRCHPEDGVVDGLQKFGFPPPCHPSYKASGSYLGGTYSR